MFITIQYKNEKCVYYSFICFSRDSNCFSSYSILVQQVLILEEDYVISPIVIWTHLSEKNYWWLHQELCTWSQLASWEQTPVASLKCLAGLLRLWIVFLKEFLQGHSVKNYARKVVLGRFMLSRISNSLFLSIWVIPYF